jgi:hypothetical protein
MKKLLRLLFITSLLLMLEQGIFIQKAFGQIAPPPPPPPDVKGSGGNFGPMESGAPIGDGGWVLLTLVVGYSIHTYMVRKKKSEVDLE